ncbi:hypothetical protein MTQ00_15395 [Chryseobacterium sp. B21-037]|uniref:DUF6804 family protein n=1 Tax=Chryseobacterium sp. B21-037 TaxID=2926038 RepID=UPI00235884E6|nr:DUF6804 family protein [Chryseobacterium sp. B21-037]MDC8105916.1 hypothetical protein [Chryseobacterium sp. B21-037]
MKPFLTFCAICCFVGVFRLPIEYYTFLRVLVSVGALIIIYSFLNNKQYNWGAIFIVILIIFNPVFPIYLYRKSIWIPIDTITGILFLLIAFAEKLDFKKEEETTEEIPEHNRQVRSPSRDIIINPKKTKEEPTNGKQSNN